jgi:hypothetical protein
MIDRLRNWLRNSREMKMRMIPKSKEIAITSRDDSIIRNLPAQ